ncbi:hypothetical protein PybrP1_005933 [[Pythium] brassicae (nom. inval.)]|nr:hypothetical protein PybrP1_005933 [[Pythium] brassicae (nom. inval.)]
MGLRFISGNWRYFDGVKLALDTINNSAANVGELSDLVLNSCHEDTCLSRAYNGNAQASHHNDLRAVLVGPSELFESMDGDVTPLRKMAVLCELLSAAHFVDETQGTDEFCPQVSGVMRAVWLDAEPHVVSRHVYTFVKARGLVTVKHKFCAMADTQCARMLALAQNFKRGMGAQLPSDQPIQGVVFVGSHAVLHAA